MVVVMNRAGEDDDAAGRQLDGSDAVVLLLLLPLLDSRCGSEAIARRIRGVNRVDCHDKQPGGGFQNTAATWSNLPFPSTDRT